MSTTNPTHATRAWNCLTTGLGVSVLLGSAALMTGCSAEQSTVAWQRNGTPHHTHPTQDWWTYQFVYYPNTQVYFEPHSGVFSWFDGESWQDDHELPRHVSIHFDHPYVVRSKSERPYYQHGTISQAFRPEHGAIAGSDELRWDFMESSRLASHPADSDQ